MADDKCANSETSNAAISIERPIAGRIVAAGHDDALIELEGGDFAIGETVILHAVAEGRRDGVATGICIGARRVKLDHYYGRTGRRVWARRPSRS